MGNNLMVLNNVTKSFDNKTVLDNISMDIALSEITFLIGPNGAGKTSLLSLLTGISEKESGEILFEDSVINIPYSNKIKKKITLVPDQPMYFDYLTVKENIKYFSQIYNITISENKVQSLIKKYKLENETNKLVKFFSRGMKQKVNLSIIEIVNSDFIILDEPTLGLDISSIIFLKETLLNLKKEGKTILITSHNTKFCEDLADNIYLIFRRL